MEAPYKFPAGANNAVSSPTLASGMPLSAMSSEKINRLSGNAARSPNVAFGVPSTPSMPILNRQFSDDAVGVASTPKNLLNDTTNFVLTGSPRSVAKLASPTGKAFPELTPGHSRASSDVQSMVARFNSLDIKDHADLRKRDVAALKRALVGREEAESEARKLKQKYNELGEEMESLKEFKQEAKNLKKELDESKERERKVMKRLDVMMEELHRAKETQAHSQNLYEKEIRKARKEAFKSSSALVKMQEELKATRNSLRVAKTDLDTATAKATEREQQAFTAEYQLVCVQQEVETMKENHRILTEERDALKSSLQDEEVARIAAEGRIALPPPIADDDDEFASPRKIRQMSPVRSPERSPWKQGGKAAAELDELKMEVDSERRRAEAAEDQIEFMKMECQFQCCSCRLAEKQSTKITHETATEQSIASIRSSILRKSSSPLLQRPSHGEADTPTVEPEQYQHTTVQPSSVDPQLESKPACLSTKLQDTMLDSQPEYRPELVELQRSIEFRPQMGLEQPLESQQPSFDYDKTHENPEPGYHSEKEISEQMMTMNDDAGTFAAVDPSMPTATEEPAVETAFLTITTTKSIPLVDKSSPDYKSFFSPSTPLTREEAIEQLRIRRGRARSVTGTPKKSSTDAIMTPRRDISAPEAKTKKTPKPAASKTGSLRR